MIISHMLPNRTARFADATGSCRLVLWADHVGMYPKVREERGSVTVLRPKYIVHVYF